jgi:hypothetical protein
MTHRTPVVLLLLTLLPVSAFAAGGMQPGLWEVTTRMEMAGMPMPPQTVRHCYTRQDVENGDRTVPQADDKNCKIKDYKLKGNTATWSIVCTGKNAMSGTGTMTTSATSFSGKSNYKMRDNGDTMNMVSHMTGKRIGDCKK